MPKASDIVFDSNISMLLKAPPGFGKTLAAATFALDGPIYMAYWDKKKPIELITYFSKFGSIGSKILRNIEYDVYGASNAGEYLEKVISLKDDCRYFAFITDSVTNLTSGAVNWSLSHRDNRKIKDKILQIIPGFDEYKVETSLASQSIDLFRVMTTNVIWTAHPVSRIKVEGSGSSIKVTKINPIVAYGSKVGDLVPGSFSEIYQFSKASSWDSVAGKSSTKYEVSFDAIGDDYAKSNIGLVGSLDITNGLFYELWKEKVKQHKQEVQNALNEAEKTAANPFVGMTTQSNQTEQPKTWNSEKGVYE